MICCNMMDSLLACIDDDIFDIDALKGDGGTELSGVSGTKVRDCISLSLCSLAWR